MNKFTLKKVLFFIMLALISTSMMGQHSRKSSRKKFQSHWFVGAEIGGTVLYGDNKMHQFSKMGFNGNINVGYAFAKHFSAYGRIGGGTLNGELKNDFKIDQSNYLLCDANFSADLVSLFGGYNKKRVFGLLIHAGVGGLQYRSSATTVDGVEYKYGYNDSPKDKKGNGIGGRKVAIDIPLGLMFKFKVADNVDFYADLAMTYADTDALDAMQRGKHKDWIATGNIGLRYRFVKPEEKKPAKQKTTTVTKKPVQKTAATETEKPTPKAVQETVTEKVEEKTETKATQETAVKNEKPSEFNIIFGFSRNDTEIHEEIIGNSDIDLIKSLENVAIESVCISSYASPEGKDDFNISVSEERSKVVKDYLTKEFGDKISNAKFNITNVGADWDNYIKTLQASKIKNKEYIIKKLNSSSYKAGTLWALSADFPEIMEFYPQLRRVEVKIAIVQK